MIEEVLMERKSLNRTMQIISVPGTKVYEFDPENKDRIFLIRLIEGENQVQFPIYFEDQLILLEKVLENKILDHAFNKYWEKAYDKLYEIKARRLNK